MNNILPIGSLVTTKIGKIEGIVIGVCIRGLNNTSIEYHVSYFLNGENKTPWLNSYEIDLKVDNSKKAGFTSYKNQKLID